MLGLNISDFQKIIEKIEQNEKCNLTLLENRKQAIWLYAEDQETELRVTLLGQIELIVSRVAFVNKRIGTMTFVLHELIHYCEVNGIHKLCIQCVNSEEMANFCKKNGFQVRNGIAYENFISGDYYIEIRTEENVCDK